MYLTDAEQKFMFYATIKAKTPPLTASRPSSPSYSPAVAFSLWDKPNEVGVTKREK